MADETAQGIAAGGALSDQYRKSLAFNALSKVYGPVAGDPARAQELENLTYSQAQHPQQLEQERQANIAATQANQFNAAANPLKLESDRLANVAAGIGNTKAQQDVDYNALANPQRLTSLQQTNAAQAQTTAQQAQAFPLEQQARQAGIASTQANTAATRQGTAIKLGEQERQAAMGILSSLSDTADQGGDIGAEFDKYADQIGQFEGVDKAHIAPLRDMLVKDPQGTIDKLQTGIMGAGLAAPGKAGAVSPIQQRVQQVQALNVTRERTGSVPDAINSALAMVPNMSGSAVIRKAAAEVPGTQEYKFQAALKQLSTSLALDDLRSLRTSGLTFGRTTNTEFQASATGFGNLDIGQDKNTLATTLRRLQTTYGKINADLDDNIKRLSIGVPGLHRAAQSSGSTSALPLSPVKNPGGGKTFEEGRTYTDAAGNHAVYRNGKFEEVK